MKTGRSRCAGEQQRTINRRKTGNVEDASVRRGSESDWLKAAGKPQPASTDPRMVTRDDLFREIDYVRRYLVERDLFFDSALLLRFTRMRAIAATLLPDRVEWIRCGYGGCRIRFRSEDERREHRRVVHWIDDESEAVA